MVGLVIFLGLIESGIGFNSSHPTMQLSAIGSLSEISPAVLKKKSTPIEPWSNWFYDQENVLLTWSPYPLVDPLKLAFENHDVR